MEFDDKRLTPEQKRNKAMLLEPHRRIRENALKFDQSAAGRAIKDAQTWNTNGGKRLMDVGCTYKVSDGRTMHIGHLSKATITENDAGHLGFGGYFLFETQDGANITGLRILAKVLDYEEALRLALILDEIRGTGG